ncbi:MAG: hypothetical protein AB8G14_16990 [Ilumatobacter sp.]
MTATIFAVVDTGTTVDTEGRSWPTAVIDATGHPEISDLARVHAIDGIGDIATEAALLDVDARDTSGVTHMLALAVIITVPVQAAFVVAFALPAQRPVLDDAAEAGHLVIATTNPDLAGDEHPLWLAIDLDPTLLADVLPS